jgi:cyclopropane fatty-acyl-phospholipid synthase-like methyltransferase
MKPTTKEDMFDFLWSYTTPLAVGAAMELGLFWLLAEHPLDATGVARALRIPQNRCGFWLQLLEHSGFLEKTSSGYAPSSTARAAILDGYSQESWAFSAREARERLPAVRDLAHHINKSGSAWKAQGLTPPDYVAQMIKSPQRARDFTRMLYELHQEFAEEVTSALDMAGVERLMDLGGGSGVMSLALLRKYPNLTCMVIDIENVCAVGREIAAEHPAGDRITYHAADFLHDNLPGGFDMVLQCDVGNYRESVFSKAHAALNQRGQLAIVGLFAPAEGVAPAPRLNWAFLASLDKPDSDLLTAGQVKTLLKQVGFQSLSEKALSQGWTLIQARK